MKKLVSLFLPTTNYELRTQSGQALLIMIMVIATALTVLLATTFTSRTDTQVTKLEEEAQKALAAAEAGIEKSLEQGLGPGQTIDISGLAGLGSYQGQTTTTLYPQGVNISFVSPLLRKDEQYTFYVAPYNRAANTFGASTAQNLTICFGSASTSGPTALEITLVSTTSTIKKRFLTQTNLGSANSSTTIRGADGAETATPANCSGSSAFRAFYIVDSTSIGINTALMIIRVLSTNTRIMVSPPGGGTLPPQGTMVTSQATSQVGATKKVQLFQSFPQIPSDFFVGGF